MSSNVGRGGTIVLDAIFTDGTGAAVDPTGPTVEILDPTDTQVVAPVTPTRNPSTGRYEYDHTVAADATLGSWTARWTGTVNGVAVSADDGFDVVAAGAVGFGASDPLVDVAELQTRLGRTLAGAELARAEAALLDASSLIRQESCTDYTTAPVEPAVAMVVLGVARRGFENPGGIRSETVGTYSVSFGGDIGGGVYLTKLERQTVRRASGCNSLHSMQVTRGRLANADAQLNVVDLD